MSNGSDIRAEFDSLDWFDLSKYQAAANFGLEEWRQQVGKRAHIDFALAREHALIEYLNQPELMPALLNEPLAASAFDQEWGDHAKGSPLYTRNVFPMSFGYAAGLVDEQQERDCDIAASIDEARPEELFEGFAHFCHPVVNLAADPDDIVADLRKYLRTLKKLKGIEGIKPVKKDDGGYIDTDWHENRILPYFDLTAWGEWTGKKNLPTFL